VPQPSSRRVLLITCVAFVALGCFNASVGPLLPEYAGHTGSQLAAVGAMFAALSIGATVTKLVCGPIGDRVGHRVVLLFGLCVMAVGLAGVVTSRSLPVLLGCAVVAGVGTSAVDFGGNLLVGTTFGRRNATALNFLHLCFGLGAVLGPAIVSLGISQWSSGSAAVFLPILVIIVLLPACFSLRVPSPISQSAAVATGTSIYRMPLVWIFAGFLGTSVGVQIGMGGWATTYLGFSTGMAAERAALVTSGYWLAISLGRLIAMLAGTRFNPHTILAVDVAGGCLASIAMIFVIGNQWLTVGAILLMGLSFGSIFPTLVGLLTATFRTAPGKAASVIMTAASLANVFLPPLQGVLLTSYGAVTTPWFATLCCLLMAVLLAGIARVNARSPQVALESTS
jgi:MFS transporter, FHS family, Na+ dependent glucose transporter 1